MLVLDRPAQCAYTPAVTQRPLEVIVKSGLGLGAVPFVGEARHILSRPVERRSVAG